MQIQDGHARDDLLRQLAAIAGLPAVGVASAADFRELEKELERRKQANTYPRFVSADTASRCRPSVILPGARTLIAVALPYDVAAADAGTSTEASGGARARQNSSRGLAGEVSLYACRPDYHRILQSRLEKLVTLLKERYGPQYRFAAFTDTGPLVDRAVAARARLGRFGKNGCFYVEPWGSYVFLGYILTDLELVDAGPEGTSSIPSDSTPPHLFALDQCAGCDLCARACPTGAIDAPFSVNPRLCLSEVTQASGLIPLELRESLGRRLFGCDTCQMACPVNKQAQKPVDTELAAVPDPEAGSRHPELAPLLSLGRSEFAATWGKTPAGWKGPNTLARNAAVVLGNYRSPTAAPSLIETMARHHSPIVRASAAWALGRILTGRSGKPPAPPIAQRIRDALVSAAQAERDPVVLAELASVVPALKPETENERKDGCP